MPILLVAVDPPSERERVLQFLVRHDPGPVERWWYDGDFEERVRFSIDPKWRGELPRTYLFDSRHKPEVRTGVPDAVALVRAGFAKVVNCADAPNATGRPCRPPWGFPAPGAARRAAP